MGTRGHARGGSIGWRRLAGILVASATVAALAPACIFEDGCDEVERRSYTFTARLSDGDATCETSWSVWVNGAKYQGRGQTREGTERGFDDCSASSQVEEATETCRIDAQGRCGYLTFVDRMSCDDDGDTCVGTFEVKHGDGAPCKYGYTIHPGKSDEGFTIH